MIQTRTVQSNYTEIQTKSFECVSQCLIIALFAFCDTLLFYRLAVRLKHQISHHTRYLYIIRLLEVLGSTVKYKRQRHRYLLIRLMCFLLLISFDLITFPTLEKYKIERDISKLLLI